MKGLIKKLIYICTTLVLCIFITPISEAVDFTFEQITPTDNNITYERIIMQNEQQKKLGTSGAGCQWPVSLEASSDGDLMLYGIDVAGLYKSTDHGENWVMANGGMGARGVGMFAIDPHNSNHVLALGLGTINGAMYISTDKADTWKKTQSFPTSGARYLWDGLEFDPVSYDSTKNLTTDVYFSTPYDRDTGIRKSPSEKPGTNSVLQESQIGLYKSTDGGETFALIINDKRLADGIVKITDDGEVYVGNQYGLFLIDKENASVEKTYLENDAEADYSKGITGLDVVQNTIYAQTWEGIYKLENDALTKITNDSYINTWPQFLEVSESNPNHIIYQARKAVDNYYVNKTVVSFDGGDTWEYVSNEKNSLFFNANWEAREKLYIIDPADDNNVMTFGCDDLVRSTDGGLNFKQAKGISNLMQGGRFNFNYYEPNLLLFSAQDYTGVISTDGGKTYSALTIPEKGNLYGGFAADRDTIYGFANVSWNGGTLTYTHDGGKNWENTTLTSTEVPHSAYYSSLQSPTNPNVLFAAEYYSKDKGYTWDKMNGCVSVFTFNYIGEKELYGADDEGNIVVSYDNGDNWEKLSDEHWNRSTRLKQQKILDLAYDQVNNYAYAIVQSIITNSSDASKTYTIEEIYKYDITNRVSSKLNIPVDTSGTMRQKSVAVDPNSTSVVYVGGAGGYFSSATALLRSIDGGDTWSVLTTVNSEKYPAKTTNQGGYEVGNIRVNPYDGRVWIACGCYGYETFDPPYNSGLLNHTAPENHTIRYVYNDKTVNEVTLKNNEKHNYIYDEDGLTFAGWYKDKEFTEEFPIGSNVYESMTLYAKMEKSIRVKFCDRNRLLWTIDLDEYDKGNEKQIPTREGYAFAGWYSDTGLNTKADFSAITSDTTVYAGWYKVTEDVFDVNTNDIANYIKYSDCSLQEIQEVDNTADVENRCIHLEVEPNCTYLVMFKMDTRFRMGLKGSNTKYWSRSKVSEPYIDERDNNGKVPVNEYVYKTIDTKEYTHLLIYYYTESGTRDFMDIKNTFKIYKLENQNVQDNNQKPEELDCSVTDSGIAFTINISDANAKPHYCFCAVYDEDGKLLGLSEVDITSDTDYTFTTHCDSASAEYAKLFLWDENCAPLTKSYTYTVLH